MKLYHSPQSRSVRPRWLLEEVGAPYELVTMELRGAAMKSPEYLKIHPHGAVPALVDGEVTMFESAAICLYLADKFPEKHLAPPVGTPARARYYQWIIYTMATFEPPVIDVFMNTVLLPEAQRSATIADTGRTKVADCARVLAEAIGSRPYLLGEQFSAADVMVGSTLAWCQMMGLLSGIPVLDAYVQRCSERPAFQRAQAA